MNSWEEKEEVPALTIKELQDLCHLLLSKKDDHERALEAAKVTKEEVDKLEHRILNYMKECGLPFFESTFGRVTVKNYSTVSQPATPEDKALFFDYLKEQGVYDQMISVNSRTLNSWVNREIEAREKRGEFGWVPPGLNAPGNFQKIQIKGK
jgi:hypothetical protein